MITNANSCAHTESELERKRRRRDDWRKIEKRCVICSKKIPEVFWHFFNRWVESENGKVELIVCRNYLLIGLSCLLKQERIRIGKEMQEARRIEEDNERKRCLLWLLLICDTFHAACFSFNRCWNMVLELRPTYSLHPLCCAFSYRILMHRKAEKDEEKRARGENTSKTWGR